MPRPAAAAIRCSMVRTLTPNDPTVVAKWPSTTCSALAGNQRSVRGRSRIPVSLLAGERVSRMISPLWRPMPS
jgi:hypothetical protein